MRIGIVICSSADLPLDFIQKADLNIMPINLKFGDEIFVDNRNPTNTKRFYKHYLANRDVVGETVPYTTKQIRDWFLNELVLKYDRVLVLTLSESHSPIFRNATDASFAILNGYRAIREKAGVKGSFSLRVIDTKNLFCPEAVIAYEAHRLVTKEKVNFRDLRKKIEELREYTYGYLVPNDLYYLRNVARKKGENQLGLVKYLLAKTLNIKPITAMNAGETFIFDKGKGFDDAVGKLFAHARAQVIRGLRAPVICMSYAGDPAEFKIRQDYRDFVSFCDKHGVQTMLSVMSTTAGVNVGPGAFDLAFATMDKL